MDVSESVLRLIIESAKERCQALALQLDKADEKQYPSPGPAALLNTIRRINRAVEEKLNQLETDSELFSILTSKQAHQHVNRWSQLLPYLHELLGLLDGAEIQNTPSPFVPSLRTLVQKYLPNAELVLASKTSLNYSFLNISQDLRKLLVHIQLIDAAEELPEYFVIITFPRVEAENILLHCVIAHEIGHGLYKKHGVSEKLLPLIEIDKAKIAEIAQAIYQAEASAAINTSKTSKNSGQGTLYPNENDLRAQIALFANNTITNWLEELGSDAIGFALFGPAYLFALIQLVVSFQLIHNASPSHPPNSLRVRLLLTMLGSFGKTNASLEIFEDLPIGLQQFAENWKSNCDPLDLPEPIWVVIVNAVLGAIDAMGKIAIEVIGKSVYVNDQILTINPLRELVVAGIPPNELIDVKNESFTYPGMIHILNAGWQVLLSDMENFARTFGKDYKSNKVESKAMLNRLILKAVELDNIRLICTGS